MQAAAGSSTNHNGLGLPSEEYVAQNSTGWNFMEDSRMGEIFVTKQGVETIQQSVYDALQEYGISGLSVAGDFLSEWGKAYGETLLKKAPFPPNVKMAVTAIFLAKKVYDVAKGVQDKRVAMIDKLMAGGVSSEVAEARADDMVNGWLLEEIGKVVIEEGINVVLDSLPVEMYPKGDIRRERLRDAAKDAIIEAWNTFIAVAESGTWERGVVR